MLRGLGHRDPLNKIKDGEWKKSKWDENLHLKVSLRHDFEQNKDIAPLVPFLVFDNKVLFRSDGGKTFSRMCCLNTVTGEVSTVVSLPPGQSISSTEKMSNDTFVLSTKARRNREHDGHERNAKIQVFHFPSGEKQFEMGLKGPDDKDDDNTISVNNSEPARERFGQRLKKMTDDLLFCQSNFDEGVIISMNERKVLKTFGLKKFVLTDFTEIRSSLYCQLLLSKKYEKCVYVMFRGKIIENKQRDIIRLINCMDSEDHFLKDIVLIPKQNEDSQGGGYFSRIHNTETIYSIDVFQNQDGEEILITGGQHHLYFFNVSGNEERSLRTWECKITVNMFTGYISVISNRYLVFGNYNGIVRIFNLTEQAIVFGGNEQYKEIMNEKIHDFDINNIQILRDKEKRKNRCNIFISARDSTCVVMKVKGIDVKFDDVDEFALKDMMERKEFLIDDLDLFIFNRKKDILIDINLKNSQMKNIMKVLLMI